MSQKVDGIINSLSELESDIDSVNLSLADMKKSLNSIAHKEIDSLLEQTRKMATSEAESIHEDTLMFRIRQRIVCVDKSSTVVLQSLSKLCMLVKLVCNDINFDIIILHLLYET